MISALFAFSTGSVVIPSGTFWEKKKSPAARINNNPTPMYKYITLLSSSIFICSSVMLTAEPNKANATTIGPIVVPKEFIPPPKLTRLAPVFGSPSKMANGLAAVCCSEKPNATINSPINIPAYKLA